MAQWIYPGDKRWSNILLETEHDFYHLPCYVELASRLEQGEPTAFYTEFPTGRLLIPLLIRDVPTDLFPNATGFLDATSPYGFPGPLFSKNISIKDAIKGIREFIAFGKKAGLVTTFLRLHPFLSNKIWSAFSHDSQNIMVINQGTTVSIDLTLLRRNHKKNIRRLYNHGFTARVDDWSAYPEFIDIYHQTMLRREAREYYFFAHEYFTSLRVCLGTTAHICTVTGPAGDLASGGLMVKTGRVVQGHLSATADKYLAMAPSKLMFYEARNWAKNANAEVFHLGGGVGGERDSLFLFKRGLGTHEHGFKTIGIIHDRNAYDRFYESWAHTHKANPCVETAYFPFYRHKLLEKVSLL